MVGSQPSAQTIYDSDEERVSTVASMPTDDVPGAALCVQSCSALLLECLNSKDSFSRPSTDAIVQEAPRKRLNAAQRLRNPARTKRQLEAKQRELMKVLRDYRSKQTDSQAAQLHMEEVQKYKESAELK